MHFPPVHNHWAPDFVIGGIWGKMRRFANRFESQRITVLGADAQRPLYTIGGIRTEFRARAVCNRLFKEQP